MTYSVATWEQWTAGYSPLDSIGESEDSKSLVREQKEFLRRIESNKPSLVLEVLNEFLASKGKETFPQTLIERISYLEEVSEEEYPEQGLISEGSLRFFLCFIQWLSRFPAFDYPDVVLSPEGNICAIWKPTKNRYFDLEFLKDGVVRFVGSYPGTKAPSKMIRFSGRTTVDNLLEASRFPHILGWDRIPA
ncbi:MAG: hypothetical protein ACP5OS_07860 [Leptospirillia bacterium]